MKVTLLDSMGYSHKARMQFSLSTPGVLGVLPTISWALGLARGCQRTCFSNFLQHGPPPKEPSKTFF